MQAWLSWLARGTVNPKFVGSIPFKTENSKSHGFELHKPSIKGVKLLLKVIKAIIIKLRFKFQLCCF